LSVTDVNINSTRLVDVGEDLEEEKDEDDEEDDEGAGEDDEDDEEEGEEFAEGEGEDEEENEMGSSSHASGFDGATLGRCSSSFLCVYFLNSKLINPYDKDERSKFSANLLMLTGLELGYVVKTIEIQCPQAIEIGQQVPGKMEIVVDRLISNASLFNKLSEYAEQKASQRRQKIPTRKAPTIIDISNRRKRKR
jgi:hypothetical protein